MQEEDATQGEPLLETRVRVNETDQEIEAEINRCAELGVFVTYFNSATLLDLWRLRRRSRA